MTLDATIRAVQAKLGVTVDGNPGPQTWNSIYRSLVGEPPVSSVPATLADERSERTIGTLLQQVQPLARALIESAAAIGIAIKIISGTRTFAEQDALYEQGRTKAGRIVTNARGGYSNHNFGIAFDIGVFEGGRYLEDSPRSRLSAQSENHSGSNGAGAGSSGTSHISSSGLRGLVT